MHRVAMRRNQSLYTVPRGELRPYLSFEGVARRVSEATVGEHAVVRHTSVANKWKTLHLLLLPGHNATRVHYNLTCQGDDGDDAPFTLRFSVAVDTRELPPPPPKSNASQPLVEGGGGGGGPAVDGGEDPKPTADSETPLPFPDVPEDRRGPRVRTAAPGETRAAVEVPDVDAAALPEGVRGELRRLEEKLQGGDITLKGYNLTKAALLGPYRAQGDGGARGGNASKVPEESTRGAVGDQPVGDAERVPPSPDGLRVEKGDSPGRPQSTSKLLSTLVGALPKAKAPEPRPEEAGGADSERAPASRKLQQYNAPPDPGFLPWERSKGFSVLLQASGSLHVTVAEIWPLSTFAAC